MAARTRVYDWREARRRRSAEARRRRQDQLGMAHRIMGRMKRFNAMIDRFLQ